MKFGDQSAHTAQICDDSVRKKRNEIVLAGGGKEEGNEHNYIGS